MSKIYASKLTKEDLQASGITEITKDARVFKGEREVFPHWLTGRKRPYLGFTICCYDENGHLIKGSDCVHKYKRKDGTIGECINWIPKTRTIGLHRIMWAWHYGEVPEGMVVDHIDNKHESLYDYRLENLQLISPRDNLVKDRALSNRELSCKMTLPLSFYEDKLNAFVNKYNNTKDQKEKHLLRSQISQYRAKIRYWKNHEAEYVKNEEERIKSEETKAVEAKALKARKERTKELKRYHKIVDEARALYKQDPSLDNSYNWRLAVNNYNEYVKTHPFKTQKQLFVELDSDNKRN